MKKHMRLPNGFGQITYLKGRNLRKPYRAMITVGKTETGKPICKILKPEGYFKTYNEAYAALIKYNEDPYTLDPGLTMEELYDRWSAEYFSTITDSSIRTVKSAWSYCSTIYKLTVRELRVRHIKSCIDTCDKPSIKGRIKSVLNIMLDYAVEYELVAKNVSRDFKVEKVEAETSHRTFSDEEMDILLKNTPVPIVNAILLQCYTGWRPQELCLIKRSDVNISQMTMTGGMKTDAGKNRTVPVCKKAQGYLMKLYEMSDGQEYLLSGMTYDKYYKKFKNIMDELGIKDHRPHDPRKQFITMCKNAGVDEYAIKHMVGHSIDDLTEKLYTERDKDWLRKEVEKI